MVPDDIGPSLGFGVWDGSPRPMSQAHAHTDIELNLVLSGGVRYFMSGLVTAIAPGELAAFWAAIPHQLIDAVPGTRCIWVVIPVGWFLQIPVQRAFVDDLLHGRFVLDQDPAGDGPGRWVEDFRTSEPLRRRAAMLEIEARMLRMSSQIRGQGPEPGRAASGSPTGAPAQVERLASHIGAHYHEDINVPAITAAVGLHPTYAMQLFKRTIGVGIWEYLTRLRLAHAQRLLLTTDRTVLDIALDAGFGSLGRFYAIFRRHCQMTPLAYRSQAPLAPVGRKRGGPRPRGRPQGPEA